MDGAWQKKWRRARSKKSALTDDVFDQARFLTVSTGRMEPFLRLLAGQPLFFAPDSYPDLVSSSAIESNPDYRPDSVCRTWTDSSLTIVGNRACFAWSSRARAIFAHPEIPPKSWRSELLAQVQLPGDFLVVDPGLPSEITVEGHHLPTVVRLSAGLPDPAAFTAIGMEELTTQPLSAADQQCLAGLSACLPNGFHWRGCQVQLLGFGHYSFPVAFLFSPDDRVICPTTPLPETELPSDEIPITAISATTSNPASDLFTTLGERWVLVDPTVADWRRDLLWDFRGQAQ